MQCDCAFFFFFVFFFVFFLFFCKKCINTRFQGKCIFSCHIWILETLESLILHLISRPCACEQNSTWPHAWNMRYVLRKFPAHFLTWCNTLLRNKEIWNSPYWLSRLWDDLEVKEAVKMTNVSHLFLLSIRSCMFLRIKIVDLMFQMNLNANIFVSF